MQPYQQQLLKAIARQAARYQTAADIIEEIGKRLLSRLTYLRRPPNHILDLGCGQGLDTALLAAAYPSAEIIATDFCAEQFNYWPKHLLASHATIYPCVAKAPQLPFPSGYFDLVFANLFLPAIIDYQAFWQEILRVLQPGGILLFSTLGKNSLKELKKSLAEWDQADCVNVFPSLHDIGDSLTAEGFSDPAIECESIEFHYSHLKNFLYELKKLGSIKLWESYPHVYKSRHFWQTLEHYYRAQFSSSEQKLIVTAEIYYAIAFAPTFKREDPQTISIPITSIQRKK